jgi:Tol biopolymer transport system component
MEDRKCHGSSRWTRTIIALTSFLCMGSLVALSQQVRASGYADPIPAPDGTPFYLPLAMFAPTPTPIPEPGRIVYETHIDWADNWELFAMDADGTHKTQLTHHQERDSDATWSPGYSQVVFASERIGADPPNREIYVMSAAGDQSGATRLTFAAGKDYDPSWSPNGERIAFVSKRDGDWDIYLMDPDGTHLVNLTNSYKGSTDTDPSWSPDGSRIAFASDRHDLGQNAEIYTMKANGTDV